jgi:hypothetical protein
MTTLSLPRERTHPSRDVGNGAAAALFHGSNQANDLTDSPPIFL